MCDELELAKGKRWNFLSFILSEGNFLKIFVLSQCIMCWIHFQNLKKTEKIFKFCIGFCDVEKYPTVTWKMSSKTNLKIEH